MIISSSNIVPSGTLSSDSGGTPDNIKTNYAGSVWNPDGANPTLTWTGSATGVTYIAGVGSGFTSVIMRIIGGGTHQITLNRNGGFFYALPEAADFTTLEVEFFGEGVLVNLAMGTSFSVPNGGEQSGYQRIPLQDTRRITSSINRSAVPVAQSTVREGLDANLRIANMRIEFARSVWFNFQKFALSTGFFYVLEDENEEQDGYMAYEPRFDGPRAHSSTRALVRADVLFKAYHGG